MKIIKDEQRLINLHPLVIYFVVSPKDPKERVEALRGLNRYRGLTRGIYRFQTVEHVGDYSADVTSELTDTIKRYNMFVRLVNDNTDCFYYAVHKVNFNLSADEVEYSMLKFITDVCKQNIKHLGASISEYTRQGDSAREKRMSIARMQETFQEAMSLTNVKHGIWARLINKETSDLSTITIKICENSPSRRNAREVPAALPGLVSEAYRTKNFENLLAWFESYQGAPDKDTSDEIARGYYNKEYSSSLKRDIHRRTRPKEKPLINMEIQHITKTILKTGREKKEYGIVITVNGESYPICFGSKDQTMIYICSLLRLKMNEKMYIHEFFNNSKGNSTRTKFKRGHSEQWLKAVYDTIFPLDAREFKDWIGKIKETHGRPLNQGKSQSVKLVEQTLDSQSSAIWFCVVNTREDEIGDSYYDISIAPDNIKIPSNMQFLIDEFSELMGI